MRISKLDFENEKNDFLHISNNNKNVKNDKQTKKQEGNRLYAGDLNSKLGLTDKIEQKKKQAQQKALMLISKAYEKDKASADNIDNMRDLIDEKVIKREEEMLKSNEYEAQKEQLREQYGVSEDSQEQKDLELLQKYQNYISGVSQEEFTKEDVSRLSELQNMSRTEYQNRVLEINKAQGVTKNNIKSINQEIEALSRNITDTGIEQLKSQDMIKAQGSKEKLMDAAESEIVGMVIQAAKDNIDESMQEEIEKAEEAAEKKEEQEERLEEQREERKEQEELLTNAVANDNLKDRIDAVKSVPNSIVDAQKNIQKIMEENNLIVEDLKGIKIDFDF